MLVAFPPSSWHFLDYCPSLHSLLPPAEAAGALSRRWRDVTWPHGWLRMKAISLETWSFIASIVGALIALVGFPLLVWQLFVARSQRLDAIRLSTSQVLLAADAVLTAHAEVAAKLRPGGDWAGHAGAVHPADDELPLVEPYLGVFERIFIAYQAGQIDAKTLDHLYGYRLRNIWANQRIVDTKLQNNVLKTYWSRLIALTYVLEAHDGKPFPLHTDTYFPADLFDQRSARKIQAGRAANQRSHV
jgi:hypothetical protein